MSAMARTLNAQGVGSAARSRGAEAVDDVLNARRHPPEAVVIGGSAGGWEAIAYLLSRIPGDFSLPVAIALHVHPDQDEHFSDHFRRGCAVHVELAWDKKPVRPGVVTFAPPDYHLLVEWDRTYSLSADDKVSFSRPSIDVLFESAASTYGPGLVGILLTGASCDGTAGIARINELGGLSVVQDPQTAEHPLMPGSAMETASPALVLSLEGMAALIRRLSVLQQQAAGSRPSDAADGPAPLRSNREPS